MLLNLDQLQQGILSYRYFIIFPLAVVEGPIVTVISGGLSAAGLLSAPSAYGLIVIADLVGDSLWYCLGKYCSRGFLHRFGRYFGLHEERLNSIAAHFHERPHRTFSLGKISHGPGILVLIAAGMVKMSFIPFILANVLPTMVKSLLLLLIGYYFGKALGSVNAALDISALIIGVAVVILFFILKRNAS